LIELWETFLLQLDAGEEGIPFFSPPAAPNDGPVESTAAAEEEA
jgi:sorting nexin-1/2